MKYAIFTLLLITVEISFGEELACYDTYMSDKSPKNTLLFFKCLETKIDKVEIAGMQSYVDNQIRTHFDEKSHSDSGLTMDDLELFVGTAIGEHFGEKAHFDALPSGAIVAFADAPDGAMKRSCNDLPGDWENFTFADGRFILGAGILGDRTYMSGSKSGSPEVALTKEHIPAHDHEVDANLLLWKNGSGPKLGPSVSSANIVDNDLKVKVKNNELPGDAHDNMPPYIALTWCKKT